METQMLDLNADVVFSADLRFTPTPDSLTSTTTSSTVNADEVDCDSSTGKDHSLQTINFSILDKNVIEIEDHSTGTPNELRLFPMVGPSPSSATVRAKYWLDLSVPENSVGGRAELGVSMANNQAPLQQPQARKSRRGPRSRSSQYRGVTFYRRTGRWESHIWDFGKQVYLGGFDTAHDAARAYDRAAIKFRGVDADINFAVGDYQEDMERMKNLAKEEFVHMLRRQSNGASRGSSRYRGVTLHKCGQWEARMGQFLGMKASDKAAIKCNGIEAVSNFKAGNYVNGGDSSNLDLKLGISLSGGGNDHRKIVTGKILQDRATGTYAEPGLFPAWERKIPSTVVSSSSTAASSGFSSSPSIPHYLHRA